MNDKEKLDILSTAALFVLGWMLGKCQAEGRDSWEAPIVPLAKALKTAGVECDYVDAILERAGNKSRPEPSGMSEET